jgi:hypothetical protein
MVVNFFSPKNDALRRTARRCQGCGMFLLPAAFAADRASPDGFQSWCRRCKSEWEQSDDGIEARFFAHLRKKLDPTLIGPPRGWTHALFRELWQRADGKCESCGAGLGEWQYSGYRIDRIDNDRGYVPGNCRLCCWPCNVYKKDKHPSVSLFEIGNLLREYGRGRIPWAKYVPGINPYVPPDMSALIVSDPQLSLFSVVSP